MINFNGYMIYKCKNCHTQFFIYDEKYDTDCIECGSMHTSPIHFEEANPEIIVQVIQDIYVKLDVVPIYWTAENYLKQLEEKGFSDETINEHLLMLLDGLDEYLN